MHVFQNLGWHSYAVFGVGCLCVAIHTSRGGRITGYAAYLGEKDSFSGTWHASGKTAKSAVREVLKIARADVAERQAMIDAAPIFWNA